LYCEQFYNTTLSPDYSLEVRFMAFQSYLTAPRLFRQLNDTGYSFADKTVADIGTGLGILPYLLRNENALNIIGIDIDRNSLMAALSTTRAENIGFINADGHNMPVKNSTFDIIFLRYIFQHVNLSACFLSEIKRTMKDGATLVAIDIDDSLNVFYPDLPDSSKKLFKAYSEYQNLEGGDRFISKKLPAFFSSAGFSEIKVKPYATVFFKEKDDRCHFQALKNAFLLVQNELEIIKNELFNKKLIGRLEFHKGLNDYFKFLNSEDNLFISKTEFLIMCKK